MRAAGARLLTGHENEHFAVHTINTIAPFHPKRRQMHLWHLRIPVILSRLHHASAHYQLTKAHTESDHLSQSDGIAVGVAAGAEVFLVIGGVIAGLCSTSSDFILSYRVRTYRGVHQFLF